MENSLSKLVLQWLPRVHYNRHHNKYYNDNKHFHDEHFDQNHNEYDFGRDYYC
jgi:hypothetical protein